MQNLKSRTEKNQYHFWVVLLDNCGLSVLLQLLLLLRHLSIKTPTSAASAFPAQSKYQLIMTYRQTRTSTRSCVLNRNTSILQIQAVFPDQTGSVYLADFWSEEHITSVSFIAVVLNEWPKCKVYKRTQETSISYLMSV